MSATPTSPLAETPDRGASGSPRRAVLRRRLIVVGSAVAVAGSIFPFTAKPISWDEWVYMGLAFYPEPQAWVLNRYAHVYAMKPFLWLAGDPYVGARLFWSALLGLTVGSLVWCVLRLPADRIRVMALTLFLLVGQDRLFAVPGVPYPDYTVMAVMTVAVCLVLPSVTRAQQVSGRHAATLGLLFVLGMKAKETALPLLLIVGVLVVAPSGRLRFDRAARRLVMCWTAGVAAGALAIMALDGAWLGDPLFSIRLRSWKELLSFNLAAIPGPQTVSWLGWMLRPENFVSFGLYIAGGLLWSRHESDRRFLLVYALPALFLLQLTVISTVAGAVFTERYTIPILPIVCVLGAITFVRLIGDRRAGDTRSVVLAWTGAVALSLIALASGVAGARLIAAGARPSSGAMNMIVAPTLILSAFIALMLLRAWPRLCAAVVAVTIVVGSAYPIGRVAVALATRRVQRQGAERFAGFYQVARAVQVDRDAVVFVSRNLYGGAIRPAVTAAVTRLNFNAPFPSRQIVMDASAPPKNADYAVVSFDEYQQWLSEEGADPERAVVSDDGAIVLICLRAPCRRRAQP